MKIVAAYEHVSSLPWGHTPKGNPALAKVRLFAHLDNVSAIPVAKAPGGTAIELPGWLVNYLNEMLRMCDNLVTGIRQEMVIGQISDEKANEYRTSLKILIGMVRMMHTQSLDPNFPDREFSKMIGGRLAQLNEYWQMFYEPGMSDSDAEKVLRDVFPE